MILLDIMIPYVDGKTICRELRKFSDIPVIMITAWVEEIELNLTPSEFDILSVLMETPNRVFTRAQLIEKAQGYSFDGYERTIDFHIKNLRKKIAE